MLSFANVLLNTRLEKLIRMGGIIHSVVTNRPNCIISPAFATDGTCKFLLETVRGEQTNTWEGTVSPVADVILMEVKPYGGGEDVYSAVIETVDDFENELLAFVGHLGHAETSNDPVPSDADLKGLYDALIPGMSISNTDTGAPLGTLSEAAYVFDFDSKWKYVFAVESHTRNENYMGAVSLSDIPGTACLEIVNESGDSVVQCLVRNMNEFVREIDILMLRPAPYDGPYETEVL